MDEKNRPNPAFEKESVRASLERLASSSVLNFCCDDSVIMQHGIFTLLVETLNSLIQAKYQSTKASQFDSHDVIMSVLLVAIFTYATASVAEVMLQARESPYCTLAGIAYKSRTEMGNILGLVTRKLIDMFTRLAASVRSRKEHPYQPRV
ncbi:hypothetical protein DKX38_019469 [Salix brachista]|uniref:Uncharacterized protein n=1 Tax=Salix brachista TaxID=2182728 RepID=A0A5N5KGJ9_9ROSI|nr:hypothetical protein DKX38_019469 [Salix brachista]